MVVLSGPVCTMAFCIHLVLAPQNEVQPAGQHIERLWGYDSAEACQQSYKLMAGMVGESIYKSRRVVLESMSECFPGQP